MNGNIISYIKDNYINSKMDPQFAVLVKGDWGSGKTFLVRKILEETYGKKYENNVNLRVVGNPGAEKTKYLEAVKKKWHPDVFDN